MKRPTSKDDKIIFRTFSDIKKKALYLAHKKKMTLSEYAHQLFVNEVMKKKVG